MKKMNEKLHELANKDVSPFDPVVIPLFFLLDWSGITTTFKDSVCRVFEQLVEKLANVTGVNFLCEVFVAHEGTCFELCCDDPCNIDCKNIFKELKRPFGCSPLYEGVDKLKEASKVMNRFLNTKKIVHTIPCFLLLGDSCATDEKTSTEMDEWIVENDALLVEFLFKRNLTEQQIHEFVDKRRLEADACSRNLSCEELQREIDNVKGFLLNLIHNPSKGSFCGYRLGLGENSEDDDNVNRFVDLFAKASNVVEASGNGNNMMDDEIADPYERECKKYSENLVTNFRTFFDTL